MVLTKDLWEEKRISGQKALVGILILPPKAMPQHPATTHLSLSFHMKTGMIPSLLEMGVRGKYRTTNERQTRHQTIHCCLNVIFKICLVAQTVNNLPAMWETWVPSLGGEDPLEKELATHSSILAWKIPWTEEPGRLLSLGLQRSRQD